MANGAAALHTREPAPGPLSKDDPGEAIEIGEVVANAAVAVARASESYRCRGALDPAGREAAAEALACLARLQLDRLEMPDFAAVALAEGRRVLNQRHGAVFRAQLNLDAATLDQASDVYITPALEIAAKVTADELLLRKAWSN